MRLYPTACSCFYVKYEIGLSGFKYYNLQFAETFKFWKHRKYKIDCLRSASACMREKMLLNYLFSRK